MDILHDREIVQVVIAGMGGSLIRSILEKGMDKMGNISRIIAQPNIDGRDVREFLINHSFKIGTETIVEENGHIYEVIVAEPITDDIIIKPSEKEMLFGPLLLKKKVRNILSKVDCRKKTLPKSH
ncbi:tRNA (adenine(22)-N(1))-methyltransferase TrmK [Virgibacillus halophilus]|uniref:tRNA (Adenine(22)-N(1))-methyltransferase TrmK n=1 Tax=Tigheibacillus halophilus TaxID=361280 RepID=A0ABU5CBS8_9BACI|nr:tRNA (adenine(22)-N(1))-methyltransferase TrmK [Virgibacillus halophilus]